VAKFAIVGSGIFKLENPAQRAKAIVVPVNHYADVTTIAQTSRNLGEATPGLDVHLLTKEDTLSTRGR